LSDIHNDDSYSQYLENMVAQRQTIRDAKHLSNNFDMEDVFTKSNVESDDLDKAYQEKETPEAFEATPAMTFVIVITVISIF